MIKKLLQRSFRSKDTENPVEAAPDTPAEPTAPATPTKAAKKEKAAKKTKAARKDGGKGKDSKKKPAYRPGTDIGALYDQMRRKGEDIPAEISAARGDMLRDLGNESQAIALYEEAARRYLQDEMWDHAESLARKVEILARDKTRATRLVWLQLQLGREDWPGARRSIEGLSDALAPSDGTWIERVVSLVDQEVFADSDVEVALSETLIALARPDRARERLQIALTRARREGRSERAEQIERRLSQFQDAAPVRREEGESEPEEAEQPRTSESREKFQSRDTERGEQQEAGATNAHRNNPFEAMLEEGRAARPETTFVDPASLLEEEVTPASGLARVIGVDPTEIADDEAGQIQYLVETLRAGLRASIPDTEGRTHYHLGKNFMSMELWDEAIESLQHAFRSPDHRAMAAEMLAQCFVEKGVYVLALGTISMALEATPPGREPLGLLYWRSRAQEAMGKTSDALEGYQRIAVLDMRFADVMDRLSRLS